MHFFIISRFRQQFRKVIHTLLSSSMFSFWLVEEKAGNLLLDRQLNNLSLSDTEDLIRSYGKPVH